MKLPLTLTLAALLISGCTAARSMASKTPDEIANLSVCMPKPALRQKIGKPDRAIGIPGGGHIDVHTVMVRNPKTNYTQAESVTLSVLSLGIVDLTAALGDAVSDCERMAGGRATGFNAKCDYKRLRIFVHYADDATSQIACIEKKEVWVGAGFYSTGDISKCPIEYKQALGTLLDTSKFPKSNLNWDPGNLSIQQQLKAMANDHAIACPTRLSQ